MTVEPDAPPNVRADPGGLDVERLRVAAQTVLEWLAGDEVEGLSGTYLEQLRHHAQALVDLRGAAASPFAAARAHALRVRNELILLATERSLTIAVWFDDALGLGDHRALVIVTDPAEAAPT